MAEGLVKYEKPDEIGRATDVGDEKWQQRAANTLVAFGYFQLNHAKNDSVRSRYWEKLVELNPLLNQIKDKAGRAKSMAKSLEELEAMVNRQGTAKDVTD
jgi:hypothetical protein